MGKYDVVLKCIQLRKLVDDKKYTKALELIDGMDLLRITSASDLKVVADVLMKVEQYDRAKEIYFRIYDTVKTRRILYRLIILCIRSGDLEDAKQLYEEYIEIDAESSDRLILKYRLDKALGSERKVLIETLKQLKQEDYMEEWAYELAKLYHKEGMADECVNECKDMILWFGDGEIVKKAKLLKRHYDGEVDLSLTADLQSVLQNELSQILEEQDNPEQIEEEQSSDGEVAQEQVVNEEPAESEAAVEEEEQTEDESEEEEGLYVTLEDFFSRVAKTKKHILLGVAGDENRMILTVVKKVDKLLKNKGFFQESKIARIQASRLNKINLEEKIAGLVGSCLLVEKAAKLTDESIASLQKLLSEHENELVIILTDKEGFLEQMLMKKEDLLKQMTAVMKL